MTRGNLNESEFDERALSFFRTNNKTSLKTIHAMFSRGVGFLAACDGLVPGFCLHHELEWMDQGADVVMRHRPDLSRGLASARACRTENAAARTTPFSKTTAGS